MYLIVEYKLKKKMKEILRMPNPSDYEKVLHWLDKESEVMPKLFKIAKAYGLDLNNKEDLEEFRGIIDIVPHEEVLNVEAFMPAKE